MGVSNVATPPGTCLGCPTAHQRPRGNLPLPLPPALSPCLPCPLPLPLPSLHCLAAAADLPLGPSVGLE